jgi:GT2 family glycosyltransferase
MGESLLFSIVIPTRNRPRQLQKLLGSLAALEFPRERFEVMVVDDGGDAPLESIVAPFATRLPLKTIRREPGGPARARNTGVQAATARYVAFIDDDCEPQTDWLRSMEKALAENPGTMIGGRTVNGLPSNPYSTASQFIINMVYAYYNQNPQDGRFFATNNMALPRERFAELGGFDEDYVTSAAEDRDLCDRWRQAGFKMVYQPGAVIRHSHELNLLSFCRQHFTYGRGAVLFQRKAARRRSGRLREHVGFHLHLPVWFVRAWRAEPPASAVKLILLFLTAQAVNAAGSFFGLLSPPRRDQEA